jgi:hypothetical protein
MEQLVVSIIERNPLVWLDPLANGKDMGFTPFDWFSQSRTVGLYLLARESFCLERIDQMESSL